MLDWLAEWWVWICTPLAILGLLLLGVNFTWLMAWLRRKAVQVKVTIVDREHPLNFWPFLVVAAAFVIGIVTVMAAIVIVEG